MSSGVARRVGKVVLASLLGVWPVCAVFQAAYSGGKAKIAVLRQQDARGPLVVNSTGDDSDLDPGDGKCQTRTAGECTLRAALEEAAAPRNEGLDAITFDIPGPPPYVIRIGEGTNLPVPEIIDPVILDGTTQPGFDTAGRSPVVELNGASAGDRAHGLKITAGGSTVKGLIIREFKGARILLRREGKNRIQGNIIRAGSDGETARNQRGILVACDDNVIESNSISGGRQGIVVFGLRNTIAGNTIKTVKGGGISFSGSSQSVISNNVLEGIGFNGIAARGTRAGTNGNRIVGNKIRKIGTDPLRVATWGVGIELGGGFTTGPTTSINNNIIEGNLIEDAESAGIELHQTGGPEHNANLEEMKGTIIRKNTVRRSGTGIRIIGETHETRPIRQFHGTVITENILEDNRQLSFAFYEGNNGPGYPLAAEFIPITGYGIHIKNVAGVEISRNRISGNADSGLVLDNAAGARVDQNEIYDNEGVQVDRVDSAYSPLGIATDGTNVFVSDSENVIREFSPTGVLLNTLGGGGSALGELAMVFNPAMEGRFLYVPDTENRRLQKLDRSGNPVLTFDDAGLGPLFSPESIDVSGSRAMVAGPGIGVLEYDTAGKFVGRFDAGECGDFFGPVVDCTPGAGTVNLPYDVAMDSEGNTYISEIATFWGSLSPRTAQQTGGNRVQKFDATGKVLHQIGAAGVNRHYGRNQGSPAGTGDGEFNSPMGIAVDSDNNLYVADHFNDRVQKFDSAGVFVARWGTTGTEDGEFDGPVGIAVDDSDQVYVSDHSGGRIQKFSSSGSFLTSWTFTPRHP